LNLKGAFCTKFCTREKNKRVYQDDQQRGACVCANKIHVMHMTVHTLNEEKKGPKCQSPECPDLPQRI
jgi:hypothetical protein